MNMFRAFMELDKLNCKILTEGKNPFLPGYEDKEDTDAKKSSVAEKQELWNFWWKKYSGLRTGLYNAQNIFTNTVKNSHLADMAQDYTVDLAEYYNKLEKLITDDSAEIDSSDITNLVADINKFFQKVHKYIQASERAIEKQVEDDAREADLIKHIRGEAGKKASELDSKSSSVDSSSTHDEEEDEIYNEDKQTYNVIYRLTYKSKVTAKSEDEAKEILLKEKKTAKIIKVELAE